jgi:Ni,Fe-hydrogenase III small subunit
LPAAAVTPVGAAGAVGGVVTADLSTMVAINQVVLAPVDTVAFGVAPAPTTLSSAKNSTSEVGDTLLRAV